MTIRWSETAIANLEQLHDYIADRNPDAAQAAAERIIAAVASLERFPYMGRVGRAPETRELVVPGTPFVIPYRATDDRVIILAVLRAEQNWPPG
ncbi:MAG: type II toxin-antitoxin system RelE/ParE family toxin [Rhodospirillales bacterium]|jgi:addiction module RelE/StbE family toxin